MRRFSGRLILDRSLRGDVKNPDDLLDSAESLTPPDPNMLAYKTVELSAEKKQTDAWSSVPIRRCLNLNIQNKLTLEDKEGSAAF